jgi:hypothetical protein
MVGDTVFVVDAAKAEPASRVTLEQQGLKEREHLQQWIIDHPEMLGADLKIVAFEFDRWVAASGAKPADRLDILALDRNGRLVVIELKRDRAVDTITMQAINYAAMANGFNLDVLADAHAAYLGPGTKPEDALAQLIAWADHISDDTLGPPRIVLVAGDFSPTVTNATLFLHAQGLDIRLIRYQLYQLSDGRLVFAASQVIPVPRAEDYMVRPRSSPVAQAAASAAQAKKAEIVTRIVNAGIFVAGTELRIVVPDKVGEDRETIRRWLEEDPTRAVVRWRQDPKRPVEWAVDGQAYACSALIKVMISKATDAVPQTEPWGVRWICDDTGKSLNQIADPLE